MLKITMPFFVAIVLISSCSNSDTNQNTAQQPEEKKTYTCRNTPELVRQGYKGKVRSVEVLDVIKDGTSGEYQATRIFNFDESGNLTEVTRPGKGLQTDKLKITGQYDIRNSYDDNKLVIIDSTNWLSDTENIIRTYNLQNEKYVIVYQRHTVLESDCIPKKVVNTHFNDKGVATGEETEPILSEGQKDLMRKHGTFAELFGTPGFELLEKDAMGNPLKMQWTTPAGQVVITSYKYQYYDN